MDPASNPPTSGENNPAPAKTDDIPVLSVNDAEKLGPDISFSQPSSPEIADIPKEPAPAVPKTISQNIPVPIFDATAEAETAKEVPIDKNAIEKPAEEKINLASNIAGIPIARPPEQVEKKEETGTKTTPPAPVLQKTEEASGMVKAIRTYKTDVAESVKNKKTSLVKMVIAEDERKKELAEFESPHSTKNIIYISLGVFLILGGMAGAFIIYSNNQAGQPQTTVQKISPIIFAENSKEFSVTGQTGDRLAKAVAQEINSANNKLDTIENIYFTETENTIKENISSSRLFQILDSRMTPSLVRSFDDRFMLGVHTFNGNHPFLILKSNYYENSFAGMLLWEQYMGRDLFPIFGIKRDVNSQIFNRPFEDMLIKNHDVRVLKDDDGTLVLFYTFSDRKTLVISTSRDTFDEVLRRLNSAGPR